MIPNPERGCMLGGEPSRGTPGTVELCIGRMVGKDQASIVIMAYVDDLLVATTSESVLKTLMTALSAHVKVRETDRVGLKETHLRFLGRSIFQRPGSSALVSSLLWCYFLCISSDCLAFSVFFWPKLIAFRGSTVLRLTRANYCLVCSVPRLDFASLFSLCPFFPFFVSDCNVHSVIQFLEAATPSPVSGAKKRPKTGPLCLPGTQNVLAQGQSEAYGDSKLHVLLLNFQQLNLKWLVTVKFWAKRRPSGKPQDFFYLAFRGCTEVQTCSSTMSRSRLRTRRIDPLLAVYARSWDGNHSTTRRDRLSSTSRDLKALEIAAKSDETQREVQMNATGGL